jgi:multiple antibiotic resistance protein
MAALLVFLLKSAIAVFVIYNPFGAIPVLMSVTPNLSPAERSRVIFRASATALGILLVFAVAGQMVFNFFHITIGAFRIAGGILLLIISISMLYGETPKSKITEAEKTEAQTKEDVAITPLGTPMMAGPGTIVTVISLMDQAQPWGEKAMVLLALPITIAVSYLVLVYGAKLVTKIGESGLRVMTRMMGLILAVIAVQFVINGLHDALPQILGK